MSASLLIDAPAETTVVGPAPSSGAPAPPSLVVLATGRPSLTGPEVGRRVVIGDRLVAGRLPDCGLVLPEQGGASRRHAEFCARDGAVLVRDLDSRNGTFLNDRRLGPEPVVLADGDRLTLGSTLLKFIGTDVESRFHEVIYRLKVEDPLTGLANRRAFGDFLEREFARARRRHRPLSLAMFDFDHFKRLNDTHGHLAGDAVLREAARVAAELVRDDECLARYGGEELALVLPEAPPDEALAAVERVRAAIGGGAIPFGAAVLRVTASAGLATLGASMSSPADLVAAADAALYRAKGAGRDRTCLVP
jgi:two-component system cell cycle response regulator